MSFSLRKWSTPRQVVPDPASMPADPQDQSPLFTTLPIEIRRNIYRQLWLDYGLTQHVLSISSNSYLQTFPCILSPEELNQEPVPPPPLHIADAPADAAGDGGAGADANGEPDQAQPHDDPGDINGALQDLTPGDATAPEPPPQSSTPWCGHYRCFRRWSRRWDHSFSRIYTACYRGGGGGRAPPDLAASPVLTAFLVCRRAYREAGESLFSSVRFSFASMTALDAFLGKVPRPLASRIQFADIMSNSAALLATGASSVDTCAHPQEVYDKVKASLPQLQELRLTLHPWRGRTGLPQRQDLEPLYALARETGSLRRLEVLLPTECSPGGGEVGRGGAPAALQGAPVAVKVVAPGWHEFDDCAHFSTPVPPLNA